MSVREERKLFFKKFRKFKTNFKKFNIITRTGRDRFLERWMVIGRKRDRRKIDRQTDRQRDRQTDRQIDS
jgi:hypothetical protein